ncbi:MAG: hypothetical protein AB2L12_04200 [Smithellaceae bacterium]
MKRVLICIFTVYFLIGFSMLLSAAEEVKKTPDKGVAAAIADDAKEVKRESVKIYKESKEAVVRDVKEIKENFPKDLKKAKDSVVEQSREIKESAKQELKEIRDGMAKPKSGNK